MKQTLLLATALAVGLNLFTPNPARADAETEALRKQIKLLEARLDQMEKKQAAQSANLSPSAGKSKTAHVAAAPIEERLAIVERKQENAAEEAKAKAEKTPTLEYNGARGFYVTSPDKQYQLRTRGYVQVESRNFFDNSQASPNNTIVLRSARPIFEAKMTDYFNGRLMLDFSGGNARVLDAYFDTKPVPDSKLFALRIGKFKAPIGLERWESEQELLFAERGQTTNLVPFRDHGVMALGEIIPDQLEYQLAYTSGSPDLIDVNGDVDNHRDINGRIFAQPFRWIGSPWVSGLGFGMAGTYGQHTNGTVANAGLTSGFVTFGQSRYFAYNATSTTNGVLWRANPEAFYYKGPFSLLGEYVLEGQELRSVATARTLKNDAWIGIATYVVTGEDASFDGVKPAHAFDPAHSQWGALELVARAGALHVDKDTFTGSAFSSIATSAKSAFEQSVGFNWYLNNAIKLNVDYAHTTFNGGAAGGTDRESENVLTTEAQFRF
jgi:phosphate-selective porin OprO/OprP